MALEKQVYRCFEDIVGPDNISEEPAVLDSYAHHEDAYSQTGGGWWMPRFEAVLLPGNTGEVQAIVKACNRWRIKFKAQTTGNGPWNCPLSEGCIGLDMRRMNRIIEINEKGMYAVIEPYVIGAQLQAELMKRGLVTGMIGPGGYTSAFPITSLEGGGFLSTAFGHQHRNLLGLEWVLPDGEILRTGSLGQGAGWFGSEGPGPSLRALACGASSTHGGVGVFTMAATKVYHWPGPREFPVDGVSPSYYWKPQPYFGLWHFNAPSYEKVADAGYKISRNEIAIMLERTAAWVLASDGGRDMDEVLRDLKEIQAQVQGRGMVCGFTVIIGAETEKEFRYKEKTLMQIIKDVDGELMPFFEDNPDYKARFMSRWLRASSGDRWNRRCGGLFIPGFLFTMDGGDQAVNLCKVSTGVKKELIEAGRLWDDGADAAHGHWCEHGRTAAIENLGSGPQNPDGWSASGDLMLRGLEMMADPENKVCSTIMGPRIGWSAGEKPGKPLPAFYNKPFYNKQFWVNDLSWVRQIRKAIDPNDVVESSTYSGE